MKLDAIVNNKFNIDHFCAETQWCLNVPRNSIDHAQEIFSVENLTRNYKVQIIILITEDFRLFCGSWHQCEHSSPDPRGLVGVKSQPNQFGQITGHILKSFSMKSLLYPVRSGGVSELTIYHDMFLHTLMKKLCIKTFLRPCSVILRSSSI